MTRLVSSSVETDTWVRIGDNTEIHYGVSPAHDDVVLAFDGLSLNMRQAGLRHCVATFSEALDRRTIAMQGVTPWPA